MSRTRCIIIEDEPLAAEVIINYIFRVPHLDLLGTFKDAIAATDFLRNNQVDLIFLDIHLPEIKGVAFLKTLPYPLSVIITTAFDQYAVEGFNLNVTDYLLKPFDFERFLTAINKVKTESQDGQRKHEAASGSKDSVFFTVQKKRVRVMFTDILFIESKQEYVSIVTADKEILTRITMHEIENLLPKEMFKRIHRSYLVAIHKIESYSFDQVEIKGHIIPVGRGYKEILNDLENR